MKCYVLIISRQFLKNHYLSGKPTFFPEKIEKALKIHTIRNNYELWKKRIDKVNAGEAYISLRYWSGKPYNSKQIEFMKLYRSGYQSVSITNNWDENKKSDLFIEIAHNDGLDARAFHRWFFPKPDSEDKKHMIIIHFSDFRYNVTNEIIINTTKN